MVKADLSGCKIDRFRARTGKLQILAEPVIRNMLQILVKRNGQIAGIDQDDPVFIIPFRILFHKIPQSCHFRRRSDRVPHIETKTLDPVGECKTA